MKSEETQITTERKVKAVIFSITEKKSRNKITPTLDDIKKIHDTIDKSIISYVEEHQMSHKTEIKKLVLSIKKDKDNSKYMLSYDSRIGVLCGFINKGYSGVDRDVLNKEHTNNIDSRISHILAPTTPVFFLIKYESRHNLLCGYFDQSGDQTITKDFLQVIRNSFNYDTETKHIVSYDTSLLGTEVAKYIRDGEIKSYEIATKVASRDKADQVYGINLEERNEISVKIKIESKQSLTGRMIEWIKSQQYDRLLPVMRDLTEEQEEKKITVKTSYENRKRSIVITRGTSPDITHSVTVNTNNDGIPDMDDFKEKIISLHEDIIKQRT